MKKVSFLFLLLFIFCGETSTNEDIKDTTITSLETLEAVTEDEPELYVMLMWHQHQPFYTKNDDGYYTIHPDSGVQEDLLSSYQDYAGSVDDILDEDLGTIPLVSKDS